MMKDDVTFLIEASSIKSMIEGDKENKGDELIKKMKAMNDGGMKLKVIVPISHLLRGIWTADPNSNIQNLQKILSFAEIGYDLHTDFKDEKKTTDELLNLMKAMDMAQKLREKYPEITPEDLFKRMQEGMQK